MKERSCQEASLKILFSTDLYDTGSIERRREWCPHETLTRSRHLSGLVSALSVSGRRNEGHTPTYTSHWRINAAAETTFIVINSASSTEEEGATEEAIVD